MAWTEERQRLSTEQTVEQEPASNWSSERNRLSDTTKTPIEEEKPLYEEVTSGLKTTYEQIDALGNVLGELSGEITKGTIAGIYKSSGDFERLLAAGVETVYDTGRMIGREAYKLGTGTHESDMEAFELTNFLTSNLEEETKKGVEYINKDPGPAGRYSQHIGEYALITQAVTRQFLKKGAELLKDPSKVSSNFIKKPFEKSMMAAAKDPNAAIKLEQGISAMVASAGQTAKELGIEETGQFVTEIVTGIVSGQLINTGKSILNYAAKKIPGSAERIGKIQAAEYLQEVFKNDPDMVKKLERGLELQKETGIQMNLAELTNNPELKAALQLMEVHTAGTITGIEARLAEQTKKVKELFPAKPELKESAVKGIEDYRSETEIALEKSANKAVDDVIEQIDNAAPIDKETLGETGRYALEAAREGMQAEVNQLYKEVGNPNIPTNRIVEALKEARKSPLKNDNYMKELDAELVSTLETNLLGRIGQQQVIKAPVKDIKLTGKTDIIPNEMSLDGVRLIESRLKERIRIANAAGELNKSRLLNKILSSVFDQYKEVKGIEANQIANLRKASAASKRLHEIFDQGEVLLASRIDVKGMERITTEGFVRNFIKPNTDSKLARTNEAVDGFYNAYGDMPEARQWFSNAFGSLLKEEIARHGERLNPKAIQQFINRHSAFLKRARIEGEFDSIVKAIKQANLADDAKVLDYKEFQKTVMSKFIGSDDPIEFVTNAAMSGRLDKLMNEVSNIPIAKRRETVEKGIKEALWEGIKRRMTTTKTASGDEILLDTGTVRKMLDDINYGKQLKTGLGETHYSSLKKLIDIVDRISPNTTKTAGLPKEHIDEKLVEKLMTGLRAAAHGFVRPDLIAAQMTMRGYKAITTKHAHNILKEAMSNPEFAKELLKLSTNIVGKDIVKTMLSPVASSVIIDRDKKIQQQ